MKKSLLAIGVLLSLAACRQDASITTPPISDALAEESIMSANKMSNLGIDINEVTDEVLYIKKDGSIRGADVFNLDTSIITDTSTRKQYFLADCGGIVVSPAAGNAKIYTISFGDGATSPNSTGCNNVRGDLYKGVIEVTVSRDTKVPQVIKTITFKNFSINGIGVSGEITVLKKIRDNNVPEFTHTSKLTMVAGAKTYEVSGTRTIDMAEGYATPLDYKDDVFKITGRNDFNNITDNRRWSMEITTPIWRDNKCEESLGFPIEGIKRFNFSGKLFELNYGQRSNCDNKATITLGNGSIKNIILK